MKTIVAEPETYRLSIADPSVMLPVYMPSKEHPCPEGHKPPAVRITQKHINAGAGADRFSCVVAEGAKDGAIPDIERSVAYFEYRTHIDKFFPSPKTRRAIIRFDILAAQGLGGLGFGEPGLYEFLPWDGPLS